MREYILTELEQSIAETTLRVGIDADGASLLRTRARRALPRLEEDLRLISRLVAEVAPRGRHRGLDGLQIGSGVSHALDADVTSQNHIVGGDMDKKMELERIRRLDEQRARMRRGK